MRVSLTARYVSHPTIEFGSRRLGARHRRLGLPRSTTVFHRAHASRTAPATVVTLRSLTSRFQFPSVGHLGRIGDRRAALSLGSPRARRA